MRNVGFSVRSSSTAAAVTSSSLPVAVRTPMSFSTSPIEISFQLQNDARSASGRLSRIARKTDGRGDAAVCGRWPIVALETPWTSGVTPSSMEPQHWALIDGRAVVQKSVRAPPAKMRSIFGVFARRKKFPAPSTPTRTTVS